MKALIKKKIAECEAACFCGCINKERKGIMTFQKTCANCHSKEILEELLKEGEE